MNKQKTLKNRLLNIPISRLWIVGVIATALQYWMMGYLGQLYAATGFPVPYMVGQTAFDGELIKSYYAVLISKGTLDDYMFVQIVDYLFMATVFFAHLFVCLAIYKSLPPIRWLQKIGGAMVMIAPLAAVFDALENLISFVMIAEPKTFLNWLAYPYSTFAVAKFSVFTLFMAWGVISIVVIIFYTAYSKLYKPD